MQYSIVLFKYKKYCSEAEHLHSTDRLQSSFNLSGNTPGL